MRYQLLLVLGLVLGIFVAAEGTPLWIGGQSATPITTNDTPFEIRIVDNNSSGITVEIQFQGLELESTSQGTYIPLPMQKDYIQPGNLPHLPQWSTWIDMGIDNDAVVTILEQDRRVFMGYELDGINDNNILLQNEWFPAEQVHLGDPVVLRDVRIAPLTVFPVRARTFGGGLEIISRMVVRIDFTPGSRNNLKTIPNRPISYGFSKLYNQILLNPVDNREITGDHQLIITPDLYADELEPLIQWRREKGIKVSVTTFSDLGGNPSSNVINDYLGQVYSQWLDVPDYVLFIGDETMFPTHSTYTPDPATIFSYYSYPGYFVNDNWFVCQEGNDFFPEFFQGRWVINSLNEIRTHIAKVILHERDLFLQDSTWFSKAVVAAGDSEPTMQTTKSWVKARLLDHGFTRVDSVFQYGQSTLLSSYINEGRNYVNYRGAGWSSGWSEVSFWIESVQLLSNLYKLPVVTGIGCGVAKFDQPENNCFGEVWMTIGTPNTPRGAAGFIGPTWNTHTYYNDAMDIGIYSALLDSADLELSPILLSGKLYMYQYFEPYFTMDPNIVEVIKTAYNQYINLGDPQLELFTEIPWRPVVDHPAFALLGSHTYNLSVHNTAQDPVVGIRVCTFYDSAHYTVDVTDDEGEVSLLLTIPYAQDSLTITVSGMNAFPAQVRIPVLSSGVWLQHYDVVIHDEAQGNDDGFLNPGEQVGFHQTLINNGNATAINVEGILSSSEPSVTIIQDEASYGNIAPDDTAGSTPNYGIGVNDQFIIGGILDFELALSDTGSEIYNMDISIPIATPDLRLISITVEDGNNGIWDIGETVDLVVEITNSGLQELPSTELVFRTNNPSVTVHDSLVVLPPVIPEDTLTISSDRFRVECSGAIMPETPVEFQLYSEYQFQTYTFSQNSPGTIIVGLITPGSPTFDDSLIYFAYDTGDTFYTECPEFQWFEIAPAAGGSGDVIGFSSSDETIPINLPFTFQYYGHEYDHVSISTDGWMAMGQTTVHNYQNTTIPREDNIPAMVAPFWDDLWHYYTETGQICKYYDDQENIFIVEYYQINHYANANQPETFEVVFYDPIAYPTETGDGEILFAYLDITNSGINHATTGIESPSQQIGIEYNFNGVFAASAHELVNGTAIKFTTDPPEMISGVPEPEPGKLLIPHDYVLDQNYPNPFNPMTTIRYGIPYPERVKLTLYNVLGRRVVTLYDGMREAGYHHVIWDGRDKNGISCAAGIYFYRLDAGEFHDSRKMVLLK